MDDETGIEIYVRPSGDRNLLMLHVPRSLRDRFRAALASGVVSAESCPMNLELTVLPEWTGEKDAVRELGPHIRVRIDELSLVLHED